MTTTEFKNEWIGFSTPEIEEQFDIDLTTLINYEIERRFDLLEPVYKKGVIDSGVKEGTIGYIAELHYFTYFKSKLLKK